MTIDFNFIVIFQILVIVQGFTTGVVLLFTDQQQGKNKWLGCLIIAMSLQVIDGFMSSSGIYRDNNWLYFSPLFYTWSYGALWYFYFQNVDNQEFTFNKKYWFHFIPLSIQVIFYLTIAFQSVDTKLWFWVNVHKPYTRYLDYYGSILLVFFYLFKSYDRLQKTEVRLRRFIHALVVFYLVALIDPLVNEAYLPPRSPKFYLVQYVLPLFTYWLGLMAYWHARKQQKMTEQIEKVEKMEKNKSQNKEANAEYTQKIVDVLTTQRLYLNPELGLTDLAQAVDLSPNIVSHCINTGLGLSFNDFVNGYRIEEVKRRLQNNAADRFTLLSIAYESGFNSKSTFNRTFKEITGFSPKDYKKMSQTTLWDDSV